VQRPRVICLAATLAAGASMLAPAPAVAQSALLPGELRPSVPAQSDTAQSDQSAQSAQSGDQAGNGPLFGPSLYGVPPESGAGPYGFVSVGNRKLKVKLRPGGAPGAATAVLNGATLRATTAMLGTAALRPPARLKRRGFFAGLPRAEEVVVRPLNLPPDFVVVPPLVPLRLAAIDLNPFGPTGVHAGAFWLLPAMEFTGGWDSNPEHMTQAKAAPEFLFAPELLVRSDWERHALNMDIHGGYIAYGSTFFPNSPVWLNRPNLDSRVNARIDIDTQDRVDIEGRLLITTDTRTSRPGWSGSRSSPPAARRSAIRTISTGSRLRRRAPSTAPSTSHRF
jgi:hypothetical protein